MFKDNNENTRATSMMHLVINVNIFNTFFSVSIVDFK